jgi:hypothetical protein
MIATPPIPTAAPPSGMTCGRSATTAHAMSMSATGDMLVGSSFPAT